MSAGRLQAEFLGDAGSRILVLMHQPGPGTHCNRECVLVVPPFAEEMNKCRRSVALLGRALARCGIAAAVVDLFGTGDSDGEFEQASWRRWVADVARAADWCAERGYRISGMLGIRLGSILATAALGTGLAPSKLVYWQPVLDGGTAVDQFLRLRTAASMMEGPGRESVKELRERLRAGATVEVAGYPLSGALAGELERLRLTDLAAAVRGGLDWFEVVREPKPATQATTAALEAFGARCSRVQYFQQVGQPFWSSAEIVIVPELITRTVAAFREAA